MTPPTSPVEWRPCWRLIPSRFPPIDLFERVADPADLEAVHALESLTNDRLRDEAGDLRLVPPEDRISGPGTGYIMAAFTHLNPEGSRFSDGTWGVYYAAFALETAIAETRHHRERFLRATREDPIEIDMRAVQADLSGELHDIRGKEESLAGIYAGDGYGASQGFARPLRLGGSWGLIYGSVRDPGGECVAAFRPPVLSNARQERHLCYCWNGENIGEIYRKTMGAGD